MIQKIVRDIDGNVITERPIGEIEIIRPPFKCVIKREGQENHELGNRVVVLCTPYIIDNSMVCEFNSYFFEEEIWCLNKVRKGACKRFLDNVWNGAFAQAEKYFNDECDRYEHLLFEREQALKNAE